MFLHDAGVTGSNPRRTLQQGLGAVAFAGPRDQARHPAFVLAPQFPVPLANDASQTSVYVAMLPRLVDAIAHDYAIDRGAAQIERSAWRSGARTCCSGPDTGCATHRIGFG